MNAPTRRLHTTSSASPSHLPAPVRSTSPASMPTSHLPNKRGIGTSIVDISDPRNPRLASQIDLGIRPRTAQARVIATS